MDLNSYNLSNTAKEFFNNLHLIVKFVDETNDSEANLIKSYISYNSLVACNLLDFEFNRDKALSCINIFYSNLANKEMCSINSLNSYLLESYVTFVEIKSIKTENDISEVSIKDCITKEEYTFTDISFFPGVKENSYLLCRLAKSENDVKIIELIEKFDIIKYQIILSNKKYITEILQNIYSRAVSAKFMKNYTIDLFYIYALSSSEYEEYFSSANSDYGINEIAEKIVAKDDIKMFFDFLNRDSSHLSHLDINEYIKRCIALFNFYKIFLHLKSLNLSEFESLDVKEAFEYMSENGYFKNTGQFLDTVNMLIDFYSFMIKNSTKYISAEKIIKELNEIKDNIFYYRNLLVKSCNGFFIDDDLVKIFNKEENPNLEFREDFDSLYGFIELNENPTATNGELYNGAVKVVSESLGLLPEKEVATLKQHHFPLIDYYFYFMKHKKMITVYDDSVSINESEVNNSITDIILTMYTDEFFSLLIHTFMRTDLFSMYRSSGKIENIKESFNKILSSLVSGNERKLEDFGLKKNFSFTADILVRFGLIENFDNFYSITDLGKNIYHYYSSDNCTDKVINLFNRK